MKKGRNFIKVLALLGCRFIAVLLRMDQKPSILMYHSFDQEGWRYGVSPVDIKKQLDFLRRNYNLVSLEKVVSFTKGHEDISNNSVAITIDDGYQDTYDVFFPLAKKWNIPFALFLTTDLSEKPNLGNLKRPNKEQLKEMYDSGLVTFGLHGHTHTHFTEFFSQKNIDTEIIESESLLQSISGVLPVYVAYPSGRYDDFVLKYFRSESRYEAGLAIHSGFVKKGDDPFRLRRIEVSRNVGSFWAFKLRLTPALEVYNCFIGKIKG